MRFKKSFTSFGNKSIGTKSQSDIISATIIILMAIALVGTAYTWGIPLIEKQQSKGMLARLESYFDNTKEGSLPKKIERVANNGGEEIFSSELDGLWTLYPYDYLPAVNPNSFNNNSIQFEIFSRVSDIAVGVDWIGDDCPASGSAPPAGVLGEKSASVVCVRAESFQTGFKIFYRVWLRELKNAAVTKTYKINLVRHPSGSSSSATRTIRISQGNIAASDTLITTEVKILLG